MFQITIIILSYVKFSKITKIIPHPDASKSRSRVTLILLENKLVCTNAVTCSSCQCGHSSIFRKFRLCRRLVDGAPRIISCWSRIIVWCEMMRDHDHNCGHLQLSLNLNHVSAFLFPFVWTVCEIFFVDIYAKWMGNS